MKQLLDYRGKPRVQTKDFEESSTIQSDAHNADVNKIMARYHQTGIIESLDESQLMFRDVSEFTDLKDALNQVILAEAEFMKLPSKVREIFEHDVALWLDSAHDEEKRDALVAAGFIEDNSKDSAGDPSGSTAEAGRGESSSTEGNEETVQEADMAAER